MKTYLATILFIIASSAFCQSTSMFVDSLRIYPTAPLPTDSIKFVAYSWHDTGSGYYDKKLVVSDSIIHIYSCWTWGPLMEEESVNDTVTLEPLHIGNYTIRYILKFLRSWELDSVEPCLTNPYYDSTFLTFTVYAPNAISDLDDEKLIGLYPNPANNSLYIHSLKSPAESVHYNITNSHGQILFQSVITGSNFTIDVSTLPPGLYFLQLTNGQQRAVRKFVKQ